LRIQIRRSLGEMSREKWLWKIAGGNIAGKSLKNKENIKEK